MGCSCADCAKGEFRDLFFTVDTIHQREARQQLITQGIKSAVELERDPVYVLKRTRRLVPPKRDLALRVAKHFVKWDNQGLDVASGLRLWSPESAKACLNLLDRILAGRYTGMSCQPPLKQCACDARSQLSLLALP